MPVIVNCPQVLDASTRAALAEAVRAAVKRWRPSFESWKLALFRSQSGKGWDLAISGPRGFRKVFTLYGPVDDLPGLVSAHMDAILAHREPG
ncbi:MAG TPA: hypothetical protein VM364_13310 [Vicinamibacterales bacterium]|nr:hypothetical protein [Vicinamibacterales bacterium]